MSDVLEQLKRGHLNSRAVPAMSKLDEALGLFPSCIKGGESWSPTCQAVLDAARQELADLRSQLVTAREAALRMVVDLFTDSVHETYTTDEIVSVVEDMIRLGKEPVKTDEIGNSK